MYNNDRMTVRAAAASALKQEPVLSDPLFATARRARVGSPVLVHTSNGEPAFWLAPYEIHDKVCGFAEVNLDGNVGRVAILGASPDDNQSWIDRSFFDRPPTAVLDELRVKHEDSTLSVPLLSFDATPVRWGWKVDAVSTRSGALVTTAFITPGGWYERPPGPPKSDREG
ncbi:MAG: hypothetical protein U0X20_24565 [Caldilineaceae bacterium]